MATNFDSKTDLSLGQHKRTDKKIEIRHIIRMVISPYTLTDTAPFANTRTMPHASRHHPHRSQDHHTSKNSVQKTICCNSTSNAPDDVRYVPETCRAKNISIKLPCCIKLAFHIISIRNIVFVFGGSHISRSST